MARDIWFKKVIFSYVPCHWKGWALVFFTVIAGFILFGMSYLVIAAIHRPDLDYVAYFAIIPVVIIGLGIADHHAE